MSNKRIERQQQRGFECDTIVLRPSPTVPELIDGEVLDHPDVARLLNDLVVACSLCDSIDKTLVALVRFPALGRELALCAECFHDLSDLALGQVV